MVLTCFVQETKCSAPPPKPAAAAESNRVYALAKQATDFSEATMGQVGNAIASLEQAEERGREIRALIYEL